MNLSSEENARNVDLQASLSKLESDIKSFSKILTKTKSANDHRGRSSETSSTEDGDITSIKQSPVKFKDLANDVIRRRRRIAAAAKWKNTDTDGWFFDPDNQSPLGRTTTLALITLDDEKTCVPYLKKKQTSRNTTNHSQRDAEPSPNLARPKPGPQSSRRVLESPEPDKLTDCFCNCLERRPILRLFLIIMFNGIVSMICSAIIMGIEKPAQERRFDRKAALENRIRELEINISNILSKGSSSARKKETLRLLEDYDGFVREMYELKDEIPWGILSAQSFITSIQTTTGNGDIVPMTTNGKIFTLIYASYGIPVFMWYIFKLGGLFRILVIKIAFVLYRCFWLDFPDLNPQVSPDRISESDSITEEDLSFGRSPVSLDTRFHPSIIGIILLIFLLSISAFISHIENISYFDSLYASFISYSTIGFGDIDIFQYSFRSNWLNFFIYGNGIHIMGYMIVSAYVTSILEKFGVRKF